ncbi:Uncharacterized protein APZ42_031326 [Daphnia magna]|uniref:Reverse transcriptase domain-containing protein n=1 Tax=Daphnia magna TaxID=35525 RepID=A0A164MXX7_9CRUS|nr:Uncharacterized protein APZ42_031326 [Daphnia magna]
MIEPSEHLSRVKGVTTGKVLVTADPLLDRVLIVNLANRQTYFRERMVLGQMEVIDYSVVPIEEANQPRGASGESSTVLLTSEGMASHTEDAITREVFKKQVSLDFPAVDTESLIDLLEEFGNCFTLRDGELGMGRKAEHRINTGTAAPPSNSPCASPVVLVKKKDGSWRFCVDYRQLNAISVKDVYPLPRIEETLSRMENACIFSTIDLESGYWQVPLHEADKEKTEFVTPDGLYQFLVMPFWLASAPGTFQRMMDLFLAGLRWSICLVYLDDIIIYGSGVREHLSRVRQVLTALQSAGLKIKVVKCQFEASEIKVLGHVIGGLGIRPDPDKIKAVVNFPIPSSFNKPGEKLKCVRSFVGLCSYYRRFIPQFAQSAKPLTDLFKKGDCFAWEAPQQARAVLLQRVDNVERPLAYASRLLSKSEGNYSITEKQCLVLVWAVKKFCSYIWGMETLVVTDHHALCWLLTKKDLAGRLARWILQLQEFLLRIAHWNGRLHSDADALSRYPTDAPQELDEELQCMFAALSVDLESKSALQCAQKTEWKLVFAELEKGKPYPQYRLGDGLLCRAKVMEDGLLLRLCVPQYFREEVMRSCHHVITAGTWALTLGTHADPTQDTGPVFLARHGRRYPRFFCGSAASVNRTSRCTVSCTKIRTPI